MAYPMGADLEGRYSEAVVRRTVATLSYLGVLLLRIRIHHSAWTRSGSAKCETDIVLVSSASSSVWVTVKLVLHARSRTY